MPHTPHAFPRNQRVMLSLTASQVAFCQAEATRLELTMAAYLRHLIDQARGWAATGEKR